MNISSFKTLSRSKKIGALIIGTTLAWSLGLPFYIGTASAASLTTISDTIVSSAPSAATNHTLVWTTPTGVATGQTILVTFDPTGLLFTVTGLVVGDFSGATVPLVVAACTAAPGEATLTSTADTFTLTMCAGDSIAAAATVTLPITGNRITNPAGVGSYVVRVTGTQTDSADTRVAIINTVTMTAKVDTSLTFTISGTATSTPANGTSTTFTTTATAIPFNTVAPGVMYTGAQQLNVATNAINGFGVTVVQNQNLTSSTGADIDLFIDGAGTAAPTAWQAPANTLGNDATYGHYGLTSADANFAGGADTFGTGLYVGNFGAGTPRMVFYHDDPSDGTTVHIGSTTVAYQLQIGTLQEAANDYNNTLTYVATPIF